MNKEEFKKTKNSIRNEIESLNNKLENAKKDYIRECAIYHEGDVIFARLGKWDTDGGEFICDNIEITTTNDFKYVFRDSHNVPYYVGNLTDVKLIKKAQ
jgi:hypothetical protein